MHLVRLAHIPGIGTFQLEMGVQTEIFRRLNKVVGGFRANRLPHSPLVEFVLQSTRRRQHKIRSRTFQGTRGTAGSLVFR